MDKKPTQYELWLDAIVIYFGGNIEDKYDVGVDMFSEFWFGEIWYAFDPFCRGEITFMEAFLAHYKCMFIVYFAFFSNNGCYVYSFYHFRWKKYNSWLSR